jgi:hypothetical protein
MQMTENNSIKMFLDLLHLEVSGSQNHTMTGDIGSISGQAKPLRR